MKKTLCFSNPAYLRTGLRQLEIEQVAAEKGGKPQKVTVPIEEIGVLVLEHPQITISHVALAALIEENVAVITCNDKFLPAGLFLPLEGHTLQARRFREQIEAALPLKKQLWQQTVRQKIINQARALRRQGIEDKPLLRWSLEVRSGDPDNMEARAAAYYWPRLFINTPLFVEEADAGDFDAFIRERYGDWPNCLLNYGYAILRAVIARALVASGLLPTLGIHHRNQYNAYCLADDIMEPYRPVVDLLVCDILQEHPNPPEPDQYGNILSPALKRKLLQIPVLDVWMERKLSPLQIAAQRTAASLAACFGGQSKELIFPEIKIKS
ncbi:MAG: type II CRISPR-associated endonuclease Cas1 [Chitinophagales bacterium]|nr:type II CRISPR-associated endonuclease Cas1 [Chitinophagales bacterium]